MIAITHTHTSDAATLAPVYGNTGNPIQVFEFTAQHDGRFVVLEATSEWISLELRDRQHGTAIEAADTYIKAHPRFARRTGAHVIVTWSMCSSP